MKNRAVFDTGRARSPTKAQRARGPATPKNVFGRQLQRPPRGPQGRPAALVLQKMETNKHFSKRKMNMVAPSVPAQNRGPSDRCANETLVFAATSPRNEQTPFCAAVSRPKPTGQPPARHRPCLLLPTKLRLYQSGRRRKNRRLPTLRLRKLAAIERKNKENTYTKGPLLLL